MKFDLTIGNPPYTSGMDINVHKAFSEISKRIVFVHPSTFLISHKGNSFNKQMKRIDVSKIETAHLLWGNAMFDIQLYVPIVVSHWNAEKNGKTIKVIDDAFKNGTYVCDYDKVHRFGPRYPELLEWVNKSVMPFVEQNGSVGSHGKMVAEKEFGFKMATMRGHPPLKETETDLRTDFYTFLPRVPGVVESNYCNKGDKDKNHPRIFSFDTEAERTNFLNYLKTKSARFVLSIFKYSQMLYRGEMTYTPWMDFTRAWHDSDLRVAWNISDELWEFIDGFIPDYYTDYSYCGIME